MAASEDQATNEQESKAQRAASVSEQIAGTGGEEGHGQTASPADEQPAEGAAVASDPGGTGLGDSASRKGEDIAEKDGKEPGRIDTGVEHESQRPTGTSTPRDMTGVDPQSG